MKYSFHPEASRELERAAEYYDNIDPILGDRFIAAIDRTLGRIVSFPQSGQPVSANARRLRLTGFPYGVVYRAMESEIVVLAVMHLQRKPGYWRDR